MHISEVLHPVAHDYIAMSVVAREIMELAHSWNSPMQSLCWTGPQGSFGPTPARIQECYSYIIPIQCLPGLPLKTSPIAWAVYSIASLLQQ